MRIKKGEKRMFDISRINNSVKYCMENVEYYRIYLKKFLPNREVRSLDEFKSLPLTDKEDLKRHYPYGFLGANLADIRAYNESSGTGGGDANRSSRVASFNTQSDIDIDLKRRTAGDLRFNKDDIIFNALPYALTTSGIHFHMAAMQAGAMVIPADNGSSLNNYRKQLDLIRRLNPTIIITSYPYVYMTLFEMFKIDPKELTRLRAIQLCGMATSREGKNKISQYFNNIPVYDTYGMSEFGAITSTCNSKNTHINDGFYVEILNPKSLDDMPDGEGGEIVITTLDREGSPKIRYRTGDIGKIYYDECECGRNTPRLEVFGRLKDLMEINGKRFMLSDFENVFYTHNATVGMYKLEFNNENDIRITIDVDADNKEQNANELKEMMQSTLNINVEFECVEVGQSRKELFTQLKSSSLKSLQSIERNQDGGGEWLVTY